MTMRDSPASCPDLVPEGRPDLVPEGRLKIAQDFSPGESRAVEICWLSPVGTTEKRTNRLPFSRPSGTQREVALRPLVPPLKRWAILARPSGTQGTDALRPLVPPLKRWAILGRPSGTRVRVRRGFTLLEMLLATLISALLMGAIYVAFDIQIRHAQAGRDVIEHSTLVHSLLARMTSDVKKCVAPIAPVQPPPLLPTPPTAGSTPAGTTSSGTPASGTTDSGSNNASSTAGGSTTTPSSSTSPSTASAAPTSRDTIQFLLGVQGGPNSLTLYISQLPIELDRSRAEILSDLRLVSYWVATDGSRPLGLVRREYAQVTADQATGSPAAANPSTEGAHLLAEEVQSLQFRYFDGTNWVDTWDGSATGADGLTPIGPPMLIEVTMGILASSHDNRFWEQPSLKFYRHVIPVLTADGIPRLGTSSGS
jgi:prepilin-type N-terminal cleavage/methylation domain-containing protein